MIEHAHGIASAAYTGQYGRRQPAFLFQNLLAGFLAYYRLKISDHHREWMWSHSGSNDIMCVIHTAYPFTHSFINRVLQHPGARSHGVYLSAKQFHAVYVQCLSLSIFLSHEYFTFQSQERRCRGSSHPMLSRASFRDDAGLTHFLSQQALSQRVINLMCSGMIQIFSLQIDFGSAQILCHLLRVVEKGWTVGIIIQQVLQFCLKIRIVFIEIVSFFQSMNFIHQCFRNILSSKRTKSSFCHRSFLLKYVLLL